MRYAELAACASMCMLLICCARPPKPSQIKQPWEFRRDVYDVTGKINDYLATQNPTNTPRSELRDAVGALAHEYAMIAGEARPLRGKTGDESYAVIASRCDDGVIVAGNLAAALASDPAKHPEARRELAAAAREWKIFNEDLAAMKFVEEKNFEPRPWWDDLVWREATETDVAPEPKTD
jgi:hypothetical protein